MPVACNGSKWAVQRKSQRGAATSYLPVTGKIERRTEEPAVATKGTVLSYIVTKNVIKRVTYIIYIRASFNIHLYLPHYANLMSCLQFIIVCRASLLTTISAKGPTDLRSLAISSSVTRTPKESTNSHRMNFFSFLRFQWCDKWCDNAIFFRHFANLQKSTSVQS